MNFWNNNRYQKVEQSSTGDPLRGLPEQKFPWTLFNSSFLDHEKDTWQYKVSCTNILPEKSSNKVKAFIFIYARSQVNQKNLEKIEISTKRLDAMGVFDWNVLEEKYFSEIICKFERLESSSEKIKEDFILFIKNKYSLNFKKNILIKKIKLSKISGFS